MFIGQGLQSLGWVLLADDLVTGQMPLNGFVGLERMVFFLYVNLYVLLRPQCFTALLYNQGWPSKRWVTFIGNTSQQMSLEYGPILRVTKHRFLTDKKVLSTQATLNGWGCHSVLREIYQHRT